MYGPRQESSGEVGLIGVFARTMLEGKQPKIFGTGEQERDFIFVDDVIDANVLVLDRGDGTTYNIGSGKGASVNKIFELYKRLLNYRWTPAYSPPRSGEVFKIILDSTKACTELGWTAQVGLLTGHLFPIQHGRFAIGMG